MPKHRRPQCRLLQLHCPISFISILVILLSITAYAEQHEGNVEVQPESEDDRKLRAEDPSISSLAKKLEEPKRYAEEMRHQYERMSHKLDLVRRVQRARVK